MSLSMALIQSEHDDVLHNSTVHAQGTPCRIEIVQAASQQSIRLQSLFTDTASKVEICISNISWLVQFLQNFSSFFQVPAFLISDGKVSGGEHTGTANIDKASPSSATRKSQNQLDKLIDMDIQASGSGHPCDIYAICRLCLSDKTDSLKSVFDEILAPSRLSQKIELLLQVQPRFMLLSACDVVSEHNG
ncbi:hypothetical protein HUJ05_007760 [Dendroctonus ponderosae]|nr:hypothetical protein HUJ05_007760 [Dendroctonus ponderosae]